MFIGGTASSSLTFLAGFISHQFVKIAVRALRQTHAVLLGHNPPQKPRDKSTTVAVLDVTNLYHIESSNGPPQITQSSGLERPCIDA